MTRDEAEGLARDLVEKIISAADAATLAEARAAGMVLSLFYAQIEEARAAFNTAVPAELTGREDIFETAVTRLLQAD